MALWHSWLKSFLGSNPACYKSSLSSSLPSSLTIVMKFIKWEMLLQIMNKLKLITFSMYFTIIWIDFSRLCVHIHQKSSYLFLLLARKQMSLWSQYCFKSGFLNLMCLFLPIAGMLWHPQGTPGELAVPDLRSGCPAQMSALPQKRWSPQAHPQWNQMGPRQLCLMDPWGEMQGIW